MNPQKVLEILEKMQLKDLDEVVNGLNIILTDKRKADILVKKSKINLGDLVIVDNNKGDDWQMYVEKLNPTKAILKLGDEHGHFNTYKVPYALIKRVSSSVKTGNEVVL
jgi:hypothetical protein